MTPLELFPPTLDAARERIAAVRPADYARSRNALEGAVTRLSPYITHGFVSLPEVLAGVAARHQLDAQQSSAGVPPKGPTSPATSCSSTTWRRCWVFRILRSPAKTPATTTMCLSNA